MGMMETITLNLKEQKRLLVLNRVNDSKMTALHAAELLGWSERHVRRMLARYRAEGAEALAHGNPQWSLENRPTMVTSKPANGHGPGRCSSTPFVGESASPFWCANSEART